jgi:Heme/copper-type cytochrome/quinol oxidases, subunit 1
MSAVIENHHDDHDHGPAKGITRWLYTTNHKDIGTLYLWFSFAMFLIGGAMAMIIRAELFQPGMQIVEPEFYNQNDNASWFDHDIWWRYAGVCWTR